MVGVLGRVLWACAESVVDMDHTYGAARRPSRDRSSAASAEITELIERLAPSLIAIPGCGALTAVKILGETAGVERFKSKDAFAPTQRHRTATSLVIEQGPAPAQPQPATGSSTPRYTGWR